MHLNKIIHIHLNTNTESGAPVSWRRAPLACGAASVSAPCFFSSVAVFAFAAAAAAVGFAAAAAAAPAAAAANRGVGFAAGRQLRYFLSLIFCRLLC